MQQTLKQQRPHPLQSDWEEWKDSPVTQHFFNFLLREANAHRKMMGMSGCRRDSVIDTGMEYTLSCTRADVYELIHSVEYVDTIEEEYENYPSGSSDINSTR